MYILKKLLKSVETRTHDDLLIVVKNNGKECKVAHIFHSLMWIKDIPQETGIEVLCLSGNTGYDGFMLDLLSSHLRVKGLIYQATEKTQLSNRFSLFGSNRRNSFYGSVYTPRYLGNNSENILNEINDPTFEIDLNSRSRIELVVNPGEEITLAFTIVEEYDLARLIEAMRNFSLWKSITSPITKFFKRRPKVQTLNVTHLSQAKA